MLIENHASRWCPFHDFFDANQASRERFRLAVVLYRFTPLFYVGRNSCEFSLRAYAFYSLCPFLFLFVLFFNLASINRRNGRRYQHVLALYVFFFVCLFLYRVTMKGLTLENVFSYMFCFSFVYGLILWIFLYNKMHISKLFS